MAASASAYEEEMEEEEEEVGMNNIFFCSFLDIFNLFVCVWSINSFEDGTWRKGGIQWEQEL